MTLYKRGNIWWVKFMISGKMYYQSTRAKQYNVAKAWANQIKVSRNMPTFDEAVKVLRMFYKEHDVGETTPLEILWDSYMTTAAAIGRVPSPRTLRSRRAVVNRLLAWIQKNRPAVKTVEGVSGPVATAFAADLKSANLKSKTRANIIGDLGTVWKTLEKASQSVHNPWASLAPADTDGERGKAFTPSQEAAVFKAAKEVGRNWYEICLVMRHTGLRYADVARLKWAEITDGVIRLEPSKTRRHKISVAIPLVDSVRRAIKALPRLGDYLFPLHAELYGKTSYSHKKLLTFRDVLDRAKIPNDDGYTIHSWRHTAATRLAAAGVDIETRKRLLGHTVDETARRYDHDEHIAENLAALKQASS